MKKSIFILVVLCLLISAMAVSADGCTGSYCSNCNSGKCDPCTQECPKHKVTYDTNNCLVVAPIDCCEYGYAERVNVLFEPAQYKTGLIFYGWDWDYDGVADFGYNYSSFLMPDHDVTLKAICVPMYYGPSCSLNCNTVTTVTPIPLILTVGQEFQVFL